MGDLKGEFAPQHELMIYATKGRYEFKNKRPHSLYRFQRVNPNDLIHPNEKPIELLKQLIKDISTENELIVDLFGGSFSTYIAAKMLNRKCISFELSEHYFNIGKQRVKETILENNIFEF